MMGATDGSELTMDSHHAASAEIARAALTEEDRAMRDQLVENLNKFQDASGSVTVDVGVVVNVAPPHQEMELDARELHYHDGMVKDHP